jgi:hypothetical protein
MSERLQFSGGINLALKLPREKYVETIAFYRDTLGFRVLDETTPSSDDLPKLPASIRPPDPLAGLCG